MRALASAVLCLCPPDNSMPLPPMSVSYRSGNCSRIREFIAMTSCASAALLTVSHKSCGLHFQPVCFQGPSLWSLIHSHGFLQPLLNIVFPAKRSTCSRVWSSSNQSRLTQTVMPKCSYGTARKMSYSIRIHKVSGDLATTARHLTLYVWNSRFFTSFCQTISPIPFVLLQVRS